MSLPPLLNYLRFLHAGDEPLPTNLIYLLGYLL